MDDDYCIDAVTAHVAASTVSTFVTSGPNKLVEERCQQCQELFKMPNMPDMMIMHLMMHFSSD